MARWIGDYDCVLRDVADRWAMLAVQGPHAREIVATALRLTLPERMKVLATTIDGAPGSPAAPATPARTGSSS